MPLRKTQKSRSRRTRRRDLETLLRESDARLQATLDCALDGVISINDTGHILYFNPAAQAIFGWTQSEVLGRSMGEVIVPERLRAGHHAGVHRFVSTRQTSIMNQRIEVPAIRRNGEEFPLELTVTAVHHHGRDIFTAYVRDITERKAMEEQVRQLAFYDTLTGLPNRRLFLDRIGQAFSNNKRNGSMSALMFMDLDKFKPLNDTHGHAAGDLLLVEVARRLRSCVRDADTVARFGGDEFVVMLGDLEPAQAHTTTARVAEKLLACLSVPYVLSFVRQDGGEAVVEHHCTTSIGVTLFGTSVAGYEEIIRRADTAMYTAKATGGNQIHFA